MLIIDFPTQIIKSKKNEEKFKVLRQAFYA